MPEQRTWEQQQDDHAMSNAEMELAECREKIKTLEAKFDAMEKERRLEDAVVEEAMIYIGINPSDGNRQKLGETVRALLVYRAAKTKEGEK